MPATSSNGYATRRDGYAARRDGYEQQQPPKGSKTVKVSTFALEFCIYCIPLTDNTVIATLAPTDPMLLPFLAPVWVFFPEE